jgi:hypothetical protein
VGKERVAAGGKVIWHGGGERVERVRMWEEGVGMEGNGVETDREVGSRKGKWI